MSSVTLEGTDRNAGLLLSPAEGFGRGFFYPSDKKMLFHAVCVYFRPFLVFISNLCNVCSNLSTFEKKPKININPKMLKKNLKNKKK